VRGSGRTLQKALPATPARPSVLDMPTAMPHVRGARPMRIASLAQSRQVFGLFARRLWLPLALFVVFNAGCVAVYVLLEGVSLPDALFWITHPHAVRPEQVRTATKLFALVVYTGVFFFQVWIAERVLVTIFADSSAGPWGRLMNQLNIAGLRDHFIICGYGQVGRTVVDQLQRAGVPFVLVERDDGLASELLKEGIPVIRGDAKRRDVLTQAGIERARGICALIDNDADNLYITITARALNPQTRIIMRAGQRRYAEAMKHAGADEVIIPEYEGGLMVARLAEQYAGRSGKLE
jgi:voltage-gated potassium channel